MAKPTVVSKDSFIGTVHPHFGLDTRHQRGRPPLHRALRSLRGGLLARIASPDSSGQTAADVAACACKSHREPRPFTSLGTGRVNGGSFSQIDKTSEARDRSIYRAGACARTR